MIVVAKSPLTGPDLKELPPARFPEVVAAVRGEIKRVVSSCWTFGLQHIVEVRVGTAPPRSVPPSPPPSSRCERGKAVRGTTVTHTHSHSHARTTSPHSHSHSLTRTLTRPCSFFLVLADAPAVCCWLQELRLWEESRTVQLLSVGTGRSPTPSHEEWTKFSRQQEEAQKRIARDTGSMLDMLHVRTHSALSRLPVDLCRSCLISCVACAGSEQCVCCGAPL